MEVAGRLRGRKREARWNNAEVRCFEVSLEIRRDQISRHRAVKLRFPMQSRRNRRRLSRRGNAKRCEYRVEFRNVARHQARLDLRWTRHRIDPQASRDLNLRCRRVDVAGPHHD